MKAKSPTVAVAAILFVVASLLAAPPARADVLIGADADLAPPLGGGEAVDLGGGFAGRLGAQLDVPLLTLTPELMGSYHKFGGDASARVYRGMGGLRLGIGEVLRPGVFAHLGVGHVSVGRRYEDELGGTAFGFDGGAMLDFTLIPLVDIGIHGAYNRLLGSGVSDFDWITAGVHVDLVF